MQQRLIKASLVFLSDDQHLVLVGVEALRGPGLVEAVHPRFGVGLSFVVNSSGESDQTLDLLVALPIDIPLKGVLITHRMQARAGDDHRLGAADDLSGNMLSEVFDDDHHLLLHRGFVQRRKAGDLTFAPGLVVLWIPRSLLDNLIEILVGDVVLQYVEDEAFLNGLAHRVEAERFRLAIRTLVAKHLQGACFRSGGEGVEAQVRLRPALSDLVCNEVFNVFRLGCFGLPQRCSHCCSCFPGLRALGLVDDDRMALPSLIKRLPVEHGSEGLQGSHDDPGALFQRLAQLGRLGLIITLSDALHHPVLAFDPGDGLLQLSVKVSTIRDDHHPVEDRLVRVVMQHGELVSRPGDGVSLSGASRVLVEVVAWSLAAFSN